MTAAAAASAAVAAALLPSCSFPFAHRLAAALRRRSKRLKTLTCRLQPSWRDLDRQVPRVPAVGSGAVSVRSRGRDGPLSCCCCCSCPLFSLRANRLRAAACLLSLLLLLLLPLPFLLLLPLFPIPSCSSILLSIFFFIFPSLISSVSRLHSSFQYKSHLNCFFFYIYNKIRVLLLYLYVLKNGYK